LGGVSLHSGSNLEMVSVLLIYKRYLFFLLTYGLLTRIVPSDSLRTSTHVDIALLCMGTYACLELLTITHLRSSRDHVLSGLLVIGSTFLSQNYGGTHTPH